MSDKKLATNKELGFLYKKCKKIRPSIISQIVFCPEFTKIIKDYKGEINDEVIFELLSAKFREMCSDNTDYRTARGIINKISKDVKGDSFAWQNN